MSLFGTVLGVLGLFTLMPQEKKAPKTSEQCTLVRHIIWSVSNNWFSTSHINILVISVAEKTLQQPYQHIFDINTKWLTGKLQAIKCYKPCSYQLQYFWWYCWDKSTRFFYLVQGWPFQDFHSDLKKRKIIVTFWKWLVLLLWHSVLPNSSDLTARS